MLQGYEVIGLAGVALCLGAYGGVQWRRDFAKSWGFSIMNLFSGIFIDISLLQDWNLASFIGNTSWILISLYGLYRCAKYQFGANQKNEQTSSDENFATAPCTAAESLDKVAV